MGQHRLAPMLDRRHQQVLFGREVVVRQPWRDAGLGRNVLHRGLVVAAPDERTVGGVDDPVLGLIGHCLVSQSNFWAHVNYKPEVGELAGGRRTKRRQARRRVLGHQAVDRGGPGELGGDQAATAAEAKAQFLVTQEPADPLGILSRIV